MIDLLSTLRRNLAAAPTPRFVVGSALAVAAAHLLIWTRLSVKNSLPWTELLNRWDSAHYTAIARDGYSGQLWAFYPAYPKLVGLLASALSTSAIPVVGALLSLGLFTATAAMVGRAALRPDAAAQALAPGSRAGWLLFLLTPASFVLHSHHTEGLFLFASFLALLHARLGSPLLAGAAVALCVLTRNQGMFVFVTAVALALGSEHAWRRAVPVIALGGAAVVGFLLFEHLAAGNALAFRDAQLSWTHSRGVGDVVRTLWLGNDWQHSDPPNLRRLIFFYAFLAVTLGLLMRRSKLLAGYALLSATALLMQGEFVNAFRFAAVVFPVFFAGGDAAAKRFPLATGLLLIALLAFNLRVTSNYAVGTWAY